jgi:hypothetical protein
MRSCPTHSVCWPPVCGPARAWLGDAAWRLDSLSDVTNANLPSGDDRLPPPWLIIVGIVGALALVFLLGAGVGQEWGAEQWGPVAAWFAGAATLAAVVVALRQANVARRESMDLQLARLMDHEVSRRRECIKALGDLWAALAGMTIEFASFTDYLDNLPRHFDPNRPRTDSVPPERLGEPLAYEMGRRIQNFYDEWVQVIQPPLFVALALLHGTAMYGAVVGINDGIKKMSAEDTEGGFIDIRKAIVAGHRPNTQPLTAMWRDILAKRSEHLRLAIQHFSLTREDVERSVRDQLGGGQPGRLP